MSLPADIRDLLAALPWTETERYPTPYGEHRHASAPIEAPHDEDLWLVWRHHKGTLKDLGYTVARDDQGAWHLHHEHDPGRALDPQARASADQAYLDALPWRDLGRTSHRDYGDAHLHEAPLADARGGGAPFWNLWRVRKEDLTSAGYRVNKRAGAWFLERYTRVSESARAHDRASLERSRAHDADLELPVPEGLALLPYQRAGVRYALERPRTLLADQMGLGKTVQALVAIGASGGLPAIVVAPASLKINWAREARAWLPEAQPVLLDGRPKPETLELLRERTPDKRLRKHVGFDDRRSSDPQELLDALAHPKRLLIINYDVLEAWLPYLREHQAPALATACLDELHYAKESRAKRTKAVRALVAPIPRVIGMTGTPILNRPKELLAQLEILGVVKELFGSGWNYLQRYTAAKETSFGWDFSGASNLAELQTILRSRVMVRRLKADVLTELPPKRRHIIAVPATGSAQRLIADENAASDRNQRTVAGYRAEVERARRDGRTETYERAVAKLREAERAAFSEMARLRYEVGMAKVPAVIEYLQTALEAGDKIIVFAHHKDVIRALRDAFPDVNVVIDGSTPALARQEAVDRFQTDENVRLFIGNLIAAGVGITLTASSHVVFAEADWTPGVLEQAADRAHRIGQRESVLVTHLVWDGSLDARMATTVLAKQKVTDRALDRDAPASALPQGDAPDGALPTPAAAEEGAAPVAAEADAAARPSGPSLDELRAPERHRANELLARRREHLEALARERATQQVADPIGHAQREALHACLRYLADLDEDRARLANGVGFNRADNTLGHYLADLDTLEAHHATVALALARTYHQQLPPLLHAAAFPDARHAA